MNHNVSRDIKDRNQTPCINGCTTGKLTYLDELTLNKQLPLRHQTSKPILGYEPTVRKSTLSNLECVIAKSDISEFSRSAINGLNYVGSIKPAVIDILPPSHVQQIRLNQQNSEQSLMRLSQCNRPVSASEVAADVHGSNIKHNMSASIAVSSLPEMSSLAYRPEKLQKNAFLRPLWETSSKRINHTSSKLVNRNFSMKPETYDSLLLQRQHNFGPDSCIKFRCNKNIAKQAMVSSANAALCPNTDHHISMDSLSSRSSFASPSATVKLIKPGSQEIIMLDSNMQHPFTVSNMESKTFKLKQSATQYDILYPYYGTFPSLSSETNTFTASSNDNTDEGKTTSSMTAPSENRSFKKVVVNIAQPGLVYYRRFSEPKASSILASGNTNSSNIAWQIIHEQAAGNSILPSQLLGQSSILASLSPSVEKYSGSVQSCIRPSIQETRTDVTLQTSKNKLQTNEDIKQTADFPKPSAEISSMIDTTHMPADVSQKIKTTGPRTSEMPSRNTTKNVNEIKVLASRNISASATEQRSIGDGAPSNVKQPSELSMNKCDKGATNLHVECDEKESDCDDDDAFTGSLEEEEDKEENRSNESFYKGERLPGDGEANDEGVTDEDDELDSFQDNSADDETLDSYSIEKSNFERPMTADLTQIPTLENLRLDSYFKSSKRPVTAARRAVIKPAFIYSMFHKIPPTINFVAEGEKTEQLPFELSRQLKWKLSPITPFVVRDALARISFKITKKNDWLGCFGKHMKSHCFKSLHEYQKLNHFPGSFHIGRKDRLWRALSKMQVHFGKQEFNFFPQTFVLPSDLKLLKQVWEEGSSKQKWIIKPPASARGIGIRVISKWSQVPRRRSVIVQKYIHRPFLINASKFDMRIYVYVSCYDPLRLYVYEDGLARFASCKYSHSSKTLSNRYMHLTNYSVNKNNSEYLNNTDSDICQGHKWSLKALWNYMKRRGINTNLIWETIRDLIIKTIISGDGVINSMTKSNTCSRYCCHELFGFDILLDEHFKPWILEVNISPSLHSNSQLDISIKGEMIKDMMNIAGFRLPDAGNSDLGTNSPFSSFCMDRRLFTTQLAPDERAKHTFYCQKYLDEQVLSSILNILTPDDVRVLCESIDEDSRKGHFQRLFPTPCTHRYLRYFEQPRYYNLLLDQWVLHYNHKEKKGIQLLQCLCEKGLHLQNPTTDQQHQKFSAISWQQPPEVPLHDADVNLITNWSSPKPTFGNLKPDTKVLGPHNSGRDSRHHLPVPGNQKKIQQKSGRLLQSSSNSSLCSHIPSPKLLLSLSSSPVTSSNDLDLT